MKSSAMDMCICTGICCEIGTYTRKVELHAGTIAEIAIGKGIVRRKEEEMKKVKSLLMLAIAGTVLSGCGAIGVKMQNSAVQKEDAVSQMQNEKQNIEESRNTEEEETSNTNGENVIQSQENGEKKNTLSVVCTNFPEYDFAKHIAGNDAEVTMLLKPGAESHSYEPTPEDMIKIQNSDLFVYVGGDSDEWVDGVLNSLESTSIHRFKLMDQVETVEEELSEGMEPEKDEQDGEKAAEDTEMDEHVWTSPANAMIIVGKMADMLGDLDAEHKEQFQKNAKNYIDEIQQVDEELKKVIDNAKRKEIIVADRFPFRYFCEEFGLKYYAAFPGCSTDTEPSAQTVAFLIDKVKKDQIPVVFHIELSNGRMADSIAEATGAKTELLNAVHNVSAEDFKSGVSYVSLMRHNVESLKEALY